MNNFRSTPVVCICRGLDAWMRRNLAGLLLSPPPRRSFSQHIPPPARRRGHGSCTRNSFKKQASGRPDGSRHEISHHRRVERWIPLIKARILFWWSC